MKKIKNIHQLFNTTLTGLRKSVIAGKEFLEKKHLSPVVIALVFAFGAGVLLVTGILALRYSTKTLATAPPWTLDGTEAITLSDTSALEIVGQSLRLKLKEYVEDVGTTLLLLHFDGNVDDEAGNITTPSSSVSYTSVDAQFDQSLVLDGKSQVRVTDDDSLTPTGEHTLETWVKFPSIGFTQYTHENGQTLLDKGDYEWYLDHSSGRMTYEVTPNSTPTWTQQAGHNFSAGLAQSINRTWDQDGIRYVRDLVVADGYILAALGDTDTGDIDANLWRCAVADCVGGTPYWEKIGGVDTSPGITITNFASGVYEGIYDLQVDDSGTYVFVGFGLSTGDGDVWRVSGFSTNNVVWEKVGGDAIYGSWALNTFEIAKTMVWHNDVLYVGLGSGGTDARIYACVGCDAANLTATPPTWSIALPHTTISVGGQNKEIVESMTVATSGGVDYLVAGLGNTTGADAEIWRSSLASAPIYSWTKIADVGLGGWNANVNNVTALAGTSGGVIYAGTGFGSNEAELYRCLDVATCTTTSGWAEIGEGEAGSWSASSNRDMVSSLYVLGDDLFVGIGSNANGEGDLYFCDDCTGTYSWTEFGGSGNDLSPNSFGANAGDVQAITVSGTSLIVGVSSFLTSGRVWRCDISDLDAVGGYSCSNSTGWYVIGGNHAFNSWTNRGINGVLTLISGDGMVFGGTYGANSTGPATVWRYDRTNASLPWQIIGGSKANPGDSSTLGWDPLTYEAIQSMTFQDGYLFVGLGNGTGDSEVWRCSGCVSGTPSWEKIGGDGIGAPGFLSWSANEVASTMIFYQDQLYVGTGNGANDAELWRCSNCTNADMTATPPEWTKVGGDSTVATYGSASEGWDEGTKYEVMAMAVYHGYLFVGLRGNVDGDAELWRFDGTNWYHTGVSGTGVIGGDARFNSWNNGYKSVRTIGVYDGDLVVGLGQDVGDAEVWRCEGCDASDPETTNPVWSQIGGDDLAGVSPSTRGWLTDTYHYVQAMSVYNGNLYVGLGYANSQSEVWRYDDTQWTLVGGDGFGWDTVNVIDQVSSMVVSHGQLFAGTGGTAAGEGTIWSYGQNIVAQSDVLNLLPDTWYHLAVQYKNNAVKLAVNGVQSGASTPAVINMRNSNRDLLIGMSYGNRTDQGRGRYLNGQLDELRISDEGIELADLQTSKYAKNLVLTANPLTVPSNLQSGVQKWSGFSANEDATGGQIRYRFSTDGGTTWVKWNGVDAWITSTDPLTPANYASETTDESTANTNLSSLPVTQDGLLWQAAFLDSDGDSQLNITDASPGNPAFQLTYAADPDGPKNPTADGVIALDSDGGLVSLTSGNAYNYTQPSFSWADEGNLHGATDADYGDSGIRGYWVIFSTSDSADPKNTVGSVFTTTPEFTVPSALTTSGTYYLRVQAEDNAFNLAELRDTVPAQQTLFTYIFDNLSPGKVNATVSPSNYASTNEFTFSWPAATDTGGSGIAGYQYKTGASSGPLSDWSSTITATSVALTDVAYKVNQNVFFVRPIDNAGNIGTQDDVNFYYGGEGPTQVQNLDIVGDSVSSTNSFAFRWDPPDTFASSSVNDIQYCWTVNTVPTSLSDCSFTSAEGVSSVKATKVGQNTFYVLAKDSDDVGGGINWGTVQTIFFTADTAAPGIPTNVDVADISIKSSSIWRLIVSWQEPVDIGSGVSYYQVWRSDDAGATFTLRQNFVAGTSYVDTGLEQITYTYYVKACNDVNDCGNESATDESLPTGKYTEPPLLTSGPTVTGITTKKAIITWSTDRTSDSRVQYGTSSGSYFPSEPSNSLQVTDHIITLNNLDPGTTYYYRVRWTDEDGNIGLSGEKSFTTDPAPTISGVEIVNLGLDSAFIRFTASGASQVKLYYGKTTAFGGLQTISTSTSEGQYTIQLEELEDGTLYNYKINAIDSEEAEYEGTILEFETLPRPQIADVKVQQVRNTAQPTLFVSWETNTPTSSIVTYYPAGNPAAARDEVNVNLINGVHQMIVRGLLPETPYVVIVRGVDRAGNEALSPAISVTTATDTRPPVIGQIKVEGSTQTTGGDNSAATSQLIISWNTDEPSTSQVEYGEGTGNTYQQRSQEDTTPKQNHLVVIPGLTPSKVYHFRAVSRDSAGNAGTSIDTVTITPKAADDALSLVMNNLVQVFGFLRDIPGLQP